MGPGWARPLGNREGGNGDGDPQARRPAIPRAMRRPAVQRWDDGAVPYDNTEGEMSHINSNRTDLSGVTPAQRAAAVVVTGLLGLFILFGVGFAQLQAVHDAAHDTRHSIAFPCH